jgi:hypothetical protein
MQRRLLSLVLFVFAIVFTSSRAFAQNWDFDARHIAMGNVSTTNVSMSMIDEQRRYTSIPLPFGLFQVLDDLDIYNPDSPKFDPDSPVECVASPILRSNRRSTTRRVALVRPAQRDLQPRSSRYTGFVPASASWRRLASPNWGGTIQNSMHERRRLPGHLHRRGALSAQCRTRPRSIGS